MKLLSVARFYFAQSVFNSTCHYKSMERLNMIDKEYSSNKNILSGINVLIVILIIICYELHFDLGLKILGILGLLLTGISLIFDLFLKERFLDEIYKHKWSAEMYKSLRNEFMELIEEIMSNSIDENVLRSRRKLLISRYSEIGKTALSTTSGDYSDAQKSLGLKLNNNEEFSWSEADINRFLPKHLKLEE